MTLYLWLRVFGRQVTEVAQDLAFHVVFERCEPGCSLIINGVMQLQELE